MTRNTFKLLFIGLLTALFLAACADSMDDGLSSPLPASDGDGDTDGDADGDVDWDYYSDADTDADTDTDADADWEYDVDTDYVEELLITNPFVYTAHDPFSTFAADVDSASYEMFRARVRDYNMLPDASSVRLEEFVNFFPYDYPVPSAQDDHPFTISLGAAPGVFREDTRLLRVGIQAEVIPPQEKKPANLVFLIDTSGSMGGGSLTLVQRVLTQTVDLLEPGDTIAIVTYAGSAGLALPPTDVSESQVITDKINSFTAGGSTAGGAGIDLAYAQAEDAFIPGGINHVVLCTDGDFNVGTSHTDGLVAQIEEKRESGITLAVIGIGGMANDSMMEAVSNAGNGVYGIVASTSDADEYVADRMLSSLVFVAKDVKIQVEFNPASVLAYRLLGYENRAIADEDFRVDSVDAGEIGSGHQVTALYELVMVGTDLIVPDGVAPPVDGDPVEGEREVLDGEAVLVKVRYKEPTATTDDPATEVQQSLLESKIELRLTDADGDMQWAAAIAAFAEILRGSPYADVANLVDIESIITAQQGTDDSRQEFVELFASASDLLLP